MADESKGNIDHLPRYLKVGENITVDTAFYKPLGKVDYRGVKSELSVGDIRLSLDFRPVEQADRDVMMKDTDYKRTRQLLSLSSPYVLTDFTMTDQNSERTLRLREILPDDVTVIFDPTKVNYGSEDDSSVNGKLIFLDRDPASPSGLSILLHEAYHLISGAIDDQTLAPIVEKLGKRYVDFSPEEAATIIKCERDAWAFSLRKLRPFFADDGVLTRNGFLSHMQYNLNTYGSYIGNRIFSDVEAVA